MARKIEPTSSSRTVQMRLLGQVTLLRDVMGQILPSSRCYPGPVVNPLWQALPCNRIVFESSIAGSQSKFLRTCVLKRLGRRPQMTRSISDVKQIGISCLRRLTTGRKRLAKLVINDLGQEKCAERKTELRTICRHRRMI